MPRGSESGRRRRRRPRPRGRLAGISAFSATPLVPRHKGPRHDLGPRGRLAGISAFSATPLVPRRNGPRHDLAREPAGTTGNFCKPPWGPGKGFPPFPPLMRFPAAPVAHAADDLAAAGTEAPEWMKVMPIPRRRRSADIRHNIAQDRQPRSSHGACTTDAMPYASLQARSSLAGEDEEAWGPAVRHEFYRPRKLGLRRSRQASCASALSSLSSSTMKR